MDIRRTARNVVYFCAVACLLWYASVAQSAPVIIDDFNEPANMANWIVNVSNPTPPSRFFRQQGGVGQVGERDLWAETLNTPDPLSVLMTSGFNPTSGESLLQFATSGRSGSRLTLQYDGTDFDGQVDGTGVALAPDPLQLRPPAYNPIELEVNNARRLDDGVPPAPAPYQFNLADGNDHFELRFACTDGVDPQGLEVGIVATSPTGGSLSWWGYAVNSSGPTTLSVAFTEFTQHGQASFGEIDSLLFFFNPYGIPNVDFALDSIAAVPEPSTLAMLALAIVVFAACRLRRRKR